jgi:hypothetical protein
MRDDQHGQDEGRDDRRPAYFSFIHKFLLFQFPLGKPEIPVESS